MHDILFANQESLTRPDLEKYAAEIGLDVAKFKKDIDDPETKKRVDDDLELAKKPGVQGTPNFFVNGRPMRAPCPTSSSSGVDDERYAPDRTAWRRLFARHPQDLHGAA